MPTRVMWLATLACVAGFPAFSQAQNQADFAVVAAELAPQIRDKMDEKFGAMKFRVAVFPFGDTDGKITITMNEPNTILQGELIVNLISASEGKYLVLDKAGLKKEFDGAGIDSVGVASNNPANTAKILKLIGTQVAIVGSIDAKSARQVQKDGLAKVNVALTVIFDDGTSIQVAGAASPGEIPRPDTLTKGRFRVQLFLTGSGIDEEIPLVTSKNPDSQYHKVFFAEVRDDLKFGTEAASYKIRISNSGNGEIGIKNPNPAAEANRVFGVAVSVDGVNSIVQDKGDGKLDYVVVHPRNARKWVLTNPNKLLSPDEKQTKGFRVLEVQKDKDGSWRDIPGFQTGELKARKFLFGNARESLAESIGITNDIGLIAVHFYPEDLPDDPGKKIEITTYHAMIGTQPGSDVKNPTFRVRPKLKLNPVEVWRIFYRKKGDCPIPLEERIPIN